MARSRDSASPKPGPCPSPSPATAEKVWEEFRTDYRKYEGLIGSLPPAERQRLAVLFRELVAEELPKWWDVALRELMTREGLCGYFLRAFVDLGLSNFDVMCSAISDMAKRIESRAKRQRDPKPRNVERDAAIVRLRDQEGLTFGKIAKRLKTLNPKWASEDGTPMKRDAVEKAYQRMKKRAADE
jgi:hypothetical protein